MKKLLLLLTIFLSAATISQAKGLHELQQEFVNLKFGLFIHFGMGTYLDEDWADPEQPATLFNPQKLNCDQWADGAQSAGMSFGCISVKHHNGFCMWNTATTPYSVMNSGIARDVLKEFTDAMHRRNMKVMFHFSILDLREKILPRHIKPSDTDFIKAQLRELLTGYGPVTALMIDGWDAPWGRISYDDISFEDIYRYVKSIQPECLVMDLNGAKYPGDALFYSDLKTYEQGAGQRIDGSKAWLPSMSCDHLQPTWFWKSWFPSMELPSAESMVANNIIPKNEAGCTFIMNVAPNTDGLLDDNALQRLAEIGRLWKNNLKGIEIEEAPEPIISANIAKHRHATGSWSYDCEIHDFANDDNFRSYWVSNRAVKEPWLMIDLETEQEFNTVAITDNSECTLKAYALEYRKNGEWHKVFSGDAPTTRQVKIHRFNKVKGDAVRLTITGYNGEVAIAEIGVYNEKR
ncbi:alpha-L-fucosidase [uncultured Muribaculum sp.]|uniref:alpha-L-fucosidase n=2 Tax=uncultured Muribaculum sp. TaxID=1918613 RepID=UPI002670A05A|nr:alpha-L-fucosidase [uncultured Muribaculum sp.]